MKYSYEPYVMRRMAEDKIFLVNPKMSFESFIDCFYAERPFFLVSYLDDGRLAITPNITVLPWHQVQGFFPLDLFPTDWEYVTVKNETYPVFITAHPVRNYEEWLKKFERNVLAFAKETLADFIMGSRELLPITAEYPYKATAREPVNV